MKKIMILGASILQLPAIQKAKEMDLDVIAVDMNPEAVGFRVDGIKKEVISTIDIPAVMEAAQKHQIGDHPRAVPISHAGTGNCCTPSDPGSQTG